MARNVSILTIKIRFDFENFTTVRERKSLTGRLDAQELAIPTVAFYSAANLSLSRPWSALVSATANRRFDIR